MELLAVPSGLYVDGVDDSGDACGSIKKSCGDGIEMLQSELGGEGSKRGIALIDWARGALE